MGQTDVPERSHQLGLMAKIYNQAERVFILLGESADKSGSAIEWLHQIDDPDFRYELPYKHSEERIIRPETQMLESLFSRPWFNRIWVLQEGNSFKDRHRILRRKVHCLGCLQKLQRIQRFREVG
ncbi:uncharacterized protein K444DRAFT_406738 [Hyaloscypha bicolor E]|uniref:Heterokaryon incompatibility domain-containing protein n=1 Tax=Hyaloscypha bicolor E TaxID=1095630 RepID=A0A2J6T9C6_9HELO|nr:uncharacterized protein K444DRAFT_406738 [Hyaloscypha bicolor E]PMD59616.1 hypothetical protein K444DRAFT_406738 [Hyaloscypha bicolor E]